MFKSAFYLKWCTVSQVRICFGKMSISCKTNNEEKDIKLFFKNSNESQANREICSIWVTNTHSIQ